MRILTDRHHHALLESLYLLFTDRYDAEVYAPYGMAWFDRWYWSFERAVHGDAVARQYLEGVWTNLQPDPTPFPHVDSLDARHPGRVIRGVELDVALEQRFDLMICSLPHNYDGFYRLAQETGARYGIQLGNDVQPWDDRADFALASSTLPGYGPEYIGKRFEYRGTPTVMYHQEFSLDTFRPGPATTKDVASFVNCFPETPSYPEFLRVARAHPEFSWKVYGALGSGKDDEFQAGDLGTTPAVADAMRSARVAYHTKYWSDGFGHVLHNWAAIGRPLIGFARYYQDKLGAPLWIEGETSFDIERLNDDELIRLLRRLVDDDDYHARLCENAAANFRRVVDFDAEAEMIGEMLGLRQAVAA